MDERGFTRAQARELDRLAIEEHGVPGIVLMEHAGRSVAQAILSSEAAGAGALSCAVFCGGGNNGGDGFVIARWLDDAGVRVECFCTADADATRGDARTAREVCARSGVVLHDVSSPELVEVARARLAAAPPRVIVDALLGTGFEGKRLECTAFEGTGFEGTVRQETARVIRLVNAIGDLPGVRTWAVDVPSGLDCDTGIAADPCVRASVTATFTAPKAGFAAARARAVLGRVLVLTIGAPRAAVDRVRRMEGGRAHRLDADGLTPR